MNAPRNESIELLPGSGYGLRVEFAFRLDRWAHHISWLDNNHPAQLLLSSVEGTAADRFPPSPPLQELVIEQQTDRPDVGKTFRPAVARHVALLLGRAGTGHWSASFELGTDPIRLAVDVACRSGERPGFIGSTYQAAGPRAHSTENGDRLVLARQSDAIVTLTPVAGWFGVQSSSPTAISICPQSTEPPATWRWCYVVGIESAKPQVAIAQ